MAAKAIVSGFMLVIAVVLLVFAVECFVPLSAKTDMNACCRKALLIMEMKGGLPSKARADLISELEGRGFTDVGVSASDGAKQGEEIRLRVEADYTYSKLSGVFARSETTQRMVYDRSSVSRKVAN